MSKVRYTVRNAHIDEHLQIGQLMVEVYSQLVGFPGPKEAPEYFEMLADVGSITKHPKCELLVAVNDNNEIEGAVVYLGDLKHYGAKGLISNRQGASGFRLLAVNPKAQGQGLGKLLSQACISKANKEGKDEILIHSTKSMQVAWAMYEKMGFVRTPEFDFLQGDLEVFGFRKDLTK